MAGWVHYLATIPRGSVPRVPRLMFATQGGGVSLGLASLLWASTTGSLGPALVGVCGATFMAAAGFFWLYGQRATPVGELRARVGAPMLAFETANSAGQLVHTDQWRGQRVLLKFFRGSW